MHSRQSSIFTRRTMISVACAAMGSACNRRSQNEVHPVRIALSASTALIHLPLWLAQELGYFRQEGLAIAFEDARGGSKAAQALVAGAPTSHPRSLSKQLH